MLNALLLVSALVIVSAEDVSGDTLAAEALAAVFPNLSIRKEPHRAIDDSWRMDKMLFFPDALAKEHVYIVSGMPTDAIERCAASGVSAQTASRKRELRIKAYLWPGETENVLAVVQYRVS
jgi:hypothetical protein